MEPEEPTERMEPEDPIDKMEPAEAIDRIEPTDAIDKIDPVDAVEQILRTESRDLTDQIDVVAESDMTPALRLLAVGVRLSQRSGRSTGRQCRSITFPT